ncbi:arginyltransferase [uncultured Propionivibrio sp.]|uniref:arginyltransferase n=1 Tax=uncultured Propionivibrio sp. TaxID=426737 RepID=UPI0029C034E8|nr:arginyltransferase [uncultured Propionivibrio sp.]
MSRPDDSELPFSLLQFYQTAGYPCSYLPDRPARSLVAAPPYLIDTPIYSHLVRRGFRRSGLFTYRPDCGTCHACVPVRLPVADFIPNRSQQRCQKRNAHLRAGEQPLIENDAHFALYQHYQSTRHAGGGMDVGDREQYADFLLRSHVETRLIEFREPDAAATLRMVSLIDVLDDGLSSVYTFFDPDLPGAGFGSYGILWQIAQCLANDLPYLYLGYWIADCRKMAYKADFQPIEGLIDGHWQRLDCGTPPD